ncbi:MAG: 2-C-methyl-D-erythritol 2,4-cyclodiphosphate synthase [Fimbriimonadaceae bacterium]
MLERNVWAVIVAAGSSTRFGRNKLLETLGELPIWRWSYEALQEHPRVEGVIFVSSETVADEIRQELGSDAQIVSGGEVRWQSSLKGVAAVPNPEAIVLVHDAARPLLSEEVISRVIEAVEPGVCAGACMPVVDTIRFSTAAGGVLDRGQLAAMQTPQGAICSELMAALEQFGEGSTDEMGACERAGMKLKLVTGSEELFKLTYASDLLRARALLYSSSSPTRELRIGFGYDIHEFSKDPKRELWLGGVLFEGETGLEGHSDADALLHAATDALLGACGSTDIGTHFPNTDPRWKNQRSETFLRHAAYLAAERGLKIVNMDCTLIAERPKVAPKIEQMRETMAGCCGLHSSKITIKATTNEGLGSLGRGEGIAAYATVLLEGL